MVKSANISKDDVRILDDRAEVMIDLDQHKYGFSGNIAHKKKIVDQKKSNVKKREDRVKRLSCIKMVESFTSAKRLVPPR